MVECLVEGKVIAGVEHASTVDPIRDLVHGVAGLPVHGDAVGPLQLPGRDVNVRGNTQAVSAVADQFGERLATRKISPDGESTRCPRHETGRSARSATRP